MWPTVICCEQNCYEESVFYPHFCSGKHGKQWPRMSVHLAAKPHGAATSWSLSTWKSVCVTFFENYWIWFVSVSFCFSFCHVMHFRVDVFFPSSLFYVKVPVCTNQHIFSSSMWKSVISDLRFLPVALLYTAELLERVPCMCPLDSLSCLDLDSLPVCLLISHLYRWHFWDHR